jgi:lipoprotein-anchoring transpeptidase ErfK/SrfK
VLTVPSGSAAEPRVRRRSRLGQMTTVVAALLTVVALGSGCGPASPAAAPPGAPPGSAAGSSDQAGSPDQAGPAGAPTAPTAPTLPADTSLIATATTAKVAVHAGAGGKVVRSLGAAGDGPLTFLVLERRGPWVKVALPTRPNGSTGWVARSDVDLTGTTYRLIVSKSEHRLDVLRGGRRVARYPVGVGRSVTPTPAGRYYLTELVRPPDPGGVYGPYAFGLSAFSTTLTSFAGGPGQLGLHGTDAPRGLGTDVSHGCLRVANSVITRLARTLPLGTPVEIRA